MGYGDNRRSPGQVLYIHEDAAGNAVADVGQFLTIEVGGITEAGYKDDAGNGGKVTTFTKDGAINAAAVDHNALANLGVGDFHPHYALVAGRAAEDLTVQNDLLLSKSGAVLNFNAGDVTITHSANTLTFGGATLVDIAAGIFELNDAVRFDTGVAIVAASYSVGRDADGTNQLHFNVPTGATFEFSVNDVAEMTLSATAVDFQDNSITTTGGGSLTGTWSDLGTVTTVDIDGGTIDGVTLDLATNTVTGTAAEFNTACSDDTFAYVSDNLSVFAATTSAQLLGVISDETGSGVLVFGTSPTIATPDINAGTVDSLTALSIRSTGAAFDLTIATATVFTAGRTLTIDPGDAARTVTLSGNPTLDDWFDQDVKSTADPTFVNLTITSFAANWTNAGRTVADLGIVTTVDINGGTIDGVTIATSSLTTPTIGDFTNAPHDHEDAAGGATLDHGLALTGKGDDDHTQYALLAGRSGGQVQVGGTAAAETYTIRATSHATPGAVICEVEPGVEAWRTLASGAFVLGRTTQNDALSISEFEKNQNQSSGFYIRNTTSGTLANTALILNSSTTSIVLRAESAGLTPTGGREPNSAEIFAASATNGMIFITNSAVPMKWKPNGQLEMTLLSGGGLNPGTNDRGSLGAPGTAWSDLALASGAVIDFGNTNYTATHSAGLLTLSGDLSLANLTITSFAANWTNAGQTVADLGTVTTADIDGGTVDGVTIGGASAGAITGTTITANTGVVTAASADVDMSAGGRLFGGGVQLNHQTLAADTNLTLDENDASVGVTLGDVSDNTITLPAASGNKGMVIHVFVVDGTGGNDAVVTRAGGDTITNGSGDVGNTTVTLGDTADFVMLICVSSSAWNIIHESGTAVA